MEPPGRREIDAAATALVARHGAQILATARRYAATPEDAEDAYQRGLEILLRKAPTTREYELVPWLQTVVKHEAFALRGQRDRHTPLTDNGDLRERPTPPKITHDRAEQYERLRQGAEALAQLKPQEIRALQLRAEGYSYREICQLTGWTYTKVAVTPELSLALAEHSARMSAVLPVLIRDGSERTVRRAARGRAAPQRTRHRPPTRASVGARRGHALGASCARRAGHLLQPLT
jgi:RNA polymerase sigma factor (sigma-70 family)